MYQFHSQFITRIMIPLLQEIMTDMSKHKKPYLDQLFYRNLTQVHHKKDFIQTYFKNFTVRQPFNRFTQEGRELQESFLQGFSHALQMRRELSGLHGAKQALFPDEENRFTRETFQHLYILAYRLTSFFEKQRIQKLIEAQKQQHTLSVQQAAHDEELLQNGQLKLIIVQEGGQEKKYYVRKEELARYGTDPKYAQLKIIPFFTIAEPYEKNEPQAVTFADLQKDMEGSGLATLETILEEHGLEVSRHFIMNGNVASGQVKDVRGQALELRVDTQLSDSDPEKYTFTFQGGQTETGQSLDGLRFHLSRQDLAFFKSTDGKRRTALEVAKPHLPSIIREKDREPDHLLKNQPAFPQNIQLRHGIFAEIEKRREFPASVSESLLQQSQDASLVINSGKSKNSFFSFLKGQRGNKEQIQKNTIILASQKFKPILAAKTRIAQKKRFQAESSNSFGSSFFHSGFSQNTARLQQSPETKKPLLPKIAIAVTAGLSSATIIGGGVLAVNQALEQSEQVQGAFTFLFSRLHHFCFA